MPVVTVEVQLKADVTENYFVKDLSYSVDNGEIVYGLRYEYRPSKAEEIFKLVKHVLTQETVDEISIKKVKMNLLPTEFYTYSITVPDTKIIEIWKKVNSGTSNKLGIIRDYDYQDKLFVKKFL